MAKTARENPSIKYMGGIDNGVVGGKITSVMVRETVGGKSKAPGKTTPSKPSKPAKPPTSRGGGPVNPPAMRKTVTVGAKSKAPTRSKSPTVTHVNATALPPTKKKRT